jgi:V-type H+-transporting ATPase subunit a
MLLLMGLFAHYAGWIYNDMFSLSVNAFGSAYSFPEGSKKAINDGHVYAFGVDPVWSQSAQDLMFYNSLKMKMSVSLGVVQMSFGVIISLFNKMHFGDTLGVFTEFIPQILFMLCLFGYMIFLIIFKWSIDWSDPAELRQPPNLIQTMMNMVLKPGQVDPKFQMYEGQGTLQAVFVLVALISVPIMLFGKPCILSMRKKPRHSEDLGAVLIDSEDSQIQHEHKSEPENEHHESEGHGDSFGDLMIHQSIHTIEFVLGTVSNTASYLRLWALSLAHSELSKVFWDKLFVMGLKSGSWAMMIVCWAAWAGITTGVLLLMDVLECFLHALRLHWVEFQGKFFEASGYSFRPFTLKQSVDAE